jgi:hypothetical protein
VSPEAQGTWLGCGVFLVGVIVGLVAGAAFGVSAAVIAAWAGARLLLWRFDRRG